MKNLNEKIPPYVTRVTETLQKSGFEAYLVGGCVRDLLLDREPKDWDVTTNAIPEEIIGLFEETFYENDYGTVGVVVSPETLSDVSGETREVSETIGFRSSDNEPGRARSVIEVTPYRLETAYSDQRHPDQVKFGITISEDLKRRDFTINALAYDASKGLVLDNFKGQEDLKNKLVRAVGNPEERFNEDALRILRAVRFATELDFEIEEKTKAALRKLALNLQKISAERIRDEFVKIILTRNAMNGIILAHNLGILKYIVPEIEEGIGVEQNGDHIYPVWEHNIRALNHAVENNWPLHVRLAALFHDVGKPATRRWAQEKNDWTFYGHDVVGGRMTRKLMQRLKFPTKMTDNVSILVRWHLFFSDVDKITLSAVRRIVANVGKENVWDLMKVRACDRIGMGRPKEKPYRLRKYEAMIEEAMRSPVSVGMLKIDGTRIMEVTHETPGPKLGMILHALLEEVLEDPGKNTAEYLEKRTLELNALDSETLKKLGEEGKEKKAEVEAEEIAKINKRHWVK